MVRIADEIVDTYQGADAGLHLDAFENEVLLEIMKIAPFSTNPIVHAFSITARRYGIEATLIKPFFESMRTDLTKKTFTQATYERYIYGSAEVVGLMCLKVFTQNNLASYESLAQSAQALSRAYQKTNFLRDIADDYHKRQRYYFPIASFEAMTDTDKKIIEKDIIEDFQVAKSGIKKLPPSAQKAVKLSYSYYFALFEKLSQSSLAQLKTKRMRLPSLYKTQILAKHLFSTTSKNG